MGQVTDLENVNNRDLKLALQLPGSVSDCGLGAGPTKSVPMAEGKVQEVGSTAGYIFGISTLNHLNEINFKIRDLFSFYFSS